MPTVKIAVTIDQDLIERLDQLVAEKAFPNRSRAVQEAIRDKLDPSFEQAMADEGLTEDGEQWPEY
jgi:metal-responsive CopG/Arc/MetJ family transcriptional regulator